MAFEYFPSAAEQQQTLVSPKPNWLMFIAAALFLALCLAVGYIVWDKNKKSNAGESKKNLVAVSVTPVPSENEESKKIMQDSLRIQLIEATTRYDILKTMSIGANDTINARNREINEKSIQIKLLLTKVNATGAEIARAKNMMSALATDIETFKVTVEKLRGEKIVLFQEKQNAGQQVDAFQKKLDSAQHIIRQQEDIIDIATTLNASAFVITSIHQKSDGTERSTVVAKYVDKLRISFDVAENHVSPSGAKELFVCVTGPDGTPISVEALGSGKFTDREGKEKFYTQKVDINYVQGSRQTVSFDWKQHRKFEPGVYKIEVFNNGFRIGQGIRHLKK